MYDFLNSSRVLTTNIISKTYKLQSFFLLQFENKSSLLFVIHNNRQINFYNSLLLLLLLTDTIDQRICTIITNLIKRIA